MSSFPASIWLSWVAVNDSPGVRVPYLDLASQHMMLMDEIRAATERVFARSSFVLGPEVEAFEREFAAYCGANHCVGLNNGTSALHTALIAAGVRPGDEVITQTNTFIATVAAILHAGAQPVLVDVARPDYGIDVAAVGNAITKKTRAIVPVHMFGYPCDLDPLIALGKQYDLPIVEDASQAHGASYRQRRVGSGHIATFSFYPGKNLGAPGEAGAVVTSDAAIAEEIRLLRNHGSSEKYVHLRVGFNYRMEGLLAAVLRVKLRHLAGWTERRRMAAQTYDTFLTGVDRPVLACDRESAYHIYPVLVPRRDAVAEKMRRRGIETNIHYPVPCHLQPGFRHLGYRAGDFPNAERLAANELSLPIYPDIRIDQIQFVAHELKMALAA